MDIQLLKISETEAINIGGGYLRSVKKISHIVNEKEIEQYKEKTNAYFKQLNNSVGSIPPVYSTTSLDPYSPNKTRGEVLAEMVVKQFGECPEPVYEYSYELHLENFTGRMINQEAYDRLCEKVNCIQNKL